MKQVSPADIAKVLQETTVAVVQFTSPDPHCGFCRGEDQAFDKFAVSHTGPAVFMRVQWSPWNKFPELQVGPAVYGIPTYFVIRQGEARAVFHGRLGQLPWLALQIENAVADRPLQLFGSRTLAPTTARVDAQSIDPLVLARATNEVLRRAVHGCWVLHGKYGDAVWNDFAYWRQRNPESDNVAFDPNKKMEEPVSSEMAAALYEADQRFLRKVRLNAITEAGCDEFFDWLRR